VGGTNRTRWGTNEGRKQEGRKTVIPPIHPRVKYRTGKKGAKEVRTKQMAVKKAELQGIKKNIRIVRARASIKGYMNN